MDVATPKAPVPPAPRQFRRSAAGAATERSPAGGEGPPAASPTARADDRPPADPHRWARDRWRTRARDPGWLLLPQRLFLGVTFTKAGVDKLVDPAFFDPAQPTSIAAQIDTFRATSPIGPLLSVAATYPTATGLLMALGEIAVGIATLLGVRVRAAAVGGALISLTLLLTVTWQTRPYYLGSDIVFLFCWLPLIAYGSGGVLSLQRFAEQRWPARRDDRWPSRRALLAQFGTAAGVIALTALGARLFRRSAPAGGEALASVADVPVGGVEPVVTSTGVPLFLVRVADQQFVAFDRTCTHAGCRVDLAPGGKTFRCPCHQGQYDARTGNVLAGPPPRPLHQVPVHVSGTQVRVSGNQTPSNQGGGNQEPGNQELPDD